MVYTDHFITFRLMFVHHYLLLYIMCHLAFITFNLLSFCHYLSFNIFSHLAFTMINLLSFRHYLPFNVLSLWRFLLLNIFPSMFFSHLTFCLLMFLTAGVCFSFDVLSIRDLTWRNVMNVHISLYSTIVVNQPKKIITINNRQTKILGVFHKEIIQVGQKKAIFTYTVQHPLITDLAVHKSFLCAPSRSIPL